jgi:hypothetical protein
MEGKDKKDRERKTMEGVVARLVTNEDRKNNLLVRPKEGEPVSFKFRSEKTRIQLNGEKADLGAIEKGQRVEVEYFTVAPPEQDVERNIARSIKLQSAGGGGQSG